MRKRKAEPLCIKCWKNKIRKPRSVSIRNNIKKIIRALERLHEGEENVKPFQQVQQETTDYETILIGLTRDRAELYDRINRRVEVLIEQGLLEEVEELDADGDDGGSHLYEGPSATRRSWRISTAGVLWKQLSTM